ncbi:MAG: GNAT family N-acetyltransferase [bacterium]|nr:GNAT family N-acetyltransferase [bacterium]
MHVQVLDAPAAFDELQEEWLHLLSQMPFQSVFFTPQWQAAWWGHFGAGHQLHLLTVRSASGELQGLAPLMITYEEEAPPRLQFIGDLDLCDYFDVLIAPQYSVAVGEALVRYLMARVDEGLELCFANLSRRSLFATFLPDALTARGLAVEMDQIETCPAISLPDDWEAYLALLRGKDRHEMRRKIRRASAAATLTYTVADDVAGLDTDLDVFFALHRLSLQHDKQDFMTPVKVAFFRHMAHQLWRQGWLELACLRADDVPIAALCCFTFGTTYAAYNAGYHPDYSHLSAGIVLFADRIRSAIERHFTCFDFLRGDEPYKYRFGATDRPIYQLVARSVCPVPGAGE